MSESEKTPTPTPASPARCDQCGAPTPLADDADEAGTHCEWCGAEYPVPQSK